MVRTNVEKTAIAEPTSLQKNPHIAADGIIEMNTTPSIFDMPNFFPALNM